MRHAFIADHLDPSLPGDANALTFRINPLQQLQGEIDIHPLFGDVAIGEMRGDILTPFGALSDVFNGFRTFFNGFLAHRFVFLAGWHAMQSPPKHNHR